MIETISALKIAMRAPDWGAFIKGMALGAALGALGAAVCQMWLWRAEDGEIEPQEGSEGSEGKHPEVLVVEQRHVVSGMGDKPSLAELTREVDSDGASRVDYASMASHRGDRTELLSEESIGELSSEEGSDELDESDEPEGEEEDVEVVDFGGDDVVVSEEESDVLPSRIRLSAQDTAPKYTKALRDAMNRRFEVISEGSFKGDNPYNDKYEATYFMADDVLAGFDGDLMRCGDEVMFAMAYDMIKAKGVRNLYLRDKSTDSDFWIKAVDGDYETAYEAQYGEKEDGADA